MPIESVSLVILTWNRWNSVYTSLSQNIASAGFPIREIVHVDNGSEHGFVDRFKAAFDPAVQVVHAENQGVAKGYNRGLALATSSHVVITGCDRIMPANWLKAWAECFEDYKNTGVIACYSQYEQGNHESSRFRGSKWAHGANARRGIRGALPVEARIHSKDFLFKAGFFREDFGLYGYEDAEWADRADRVARENGLINYVVEHQFAKHLDCHDFEPKVGALDYQTFKKTDHTDPRKRALYLKCKATNSPHYNPYARIEQNQLGKV